MKTDLLSGFGLRMAPATQLPRHRLQGFFDDCFGRSRKLVREIYSLRTAPRSCWLYSHALLHQDQIVAAIEYWPVLLPDRRRARLLGPLGVGSGWRGRGFSRYLISRTLAMLEADARFAGVLVSGQAGIYQSFGFRRELTEGLILPVSTPPNVFLGLNIATHSPINWCSGVVKPDQSSLDSS